MIELKAQDFGREFLKNVDKLLSDQSLTCHDVADIYWSFFEALKEFKGTSHGFTGFSELIIFRFLINLLDGPFEPVQVTKDTWEFKSNSNKLTLKQNISLGRFRPDIAIYYGDKLKAIFQVKIYPPAVTSKKNITIEKELLTLMEIRDKHEYANEMKALMIIFDRQSKYNAALNELTAQKDKHPWFDFVFLRDNPKPLAELLVKSL